MSDEDTKTGKVDYIRTCKFLQADRIFIVAAGYFGEGGKNGFNAYALVQRLIKPGKPISQISSEFEKSALKPFTKMLKSYYRDNPKDLKAKCDGKECLQLILASSTGNGAEYTAQRFHVEIRRNPKVTKVVTNHCPGDCPIPGYIILGDSIEAQKALNENPHLWKDYGPPQAIDRLFQMESTAHPTEVGGPVSILKLDNRGIAWLPDHQGLCSEIKSAENPSK